MPSRLVLAAVAVLAVLPATPAVADAQRVVVRRHPPAERATTRVVVQRRPAAPSRQLSLAVGALRYDRDGGGQHPMAALRADWRLRHWLRSEVALSYALADLDFPTADPLVSEEVQTSLVAGTVGVQAELPGRWVRPYVGVAAGLFGRFEGDGEARDGEHTVRPTLAVPVGVRLPLAARLGIRAEARWRFDEHRDGRSSPAVEQTVGLSFGF